MDSTSTWAIPVRRAPSREGSRSLRALEAAAGEGASVLLLGLEELGDECFDVLRAADVAAVRVVDRPAAIRALSNQAAEIVLVEAGVPIGPVDAAAGH